MTLRYGSRGGDTSVGTGRVESHGTPGKQTLVQQAYDAMPARPASSAGDRLGGDQAGEDEQRPLGGDETGPARTGSETGSVVGGDASSISTSNLVAAEWKEHGEFKWWIRWVTDGKRGWIVQRIVNTYSGTDGSGGAITNASVGATPSYYEAWEVDSSGVITGSLGATGNRDRWERPSMGNGSRGTWSMAGTVYWTNEDPARSGFTSGGVGNAGSLLSSLTAPRGLSAVLATRSARGTWNSTGATPTHTGSAS